MLQYKDVFALAASKGYEFYIRSVRDIMNASENSMETTKECIYLECCMLQKWLRDTKGIDIEINNEFTTAKAGKWYFPTVYPSDNSSRKTLSTNQDTSYEKALLQGINAALQLI